MHGFDGDLLIGGMRLRHLHGELEEEEHDSLPDDWRFHGRLHLAAAEQHMLELNRRYRLELEDGRAAAVVIARIEPETDDHVVAEFVPAPAKPR